LMNVVDKKIFTLFMLSLAMVLAAEKLGLRDNPITFIHKESSLQPGEVVLIEARSSRPLKELAIKVFSRDFPAFSADGGLQWTGLAGIDIETKPAEYPVKLGGTDKDGKSVTADGILTVRAKKFPERKLIVDEKYVTPPADVLNRIEQESKRVNAIFGTITPGRIWNGSFLVPVPGNVISDFGKRSIYNGRPRSPHTGVDFRGAVGMHIRAPNAGIVVLAADLYFSGNTVIIDHGLGLYSYLGHMSDLSVKEGERVEAGDTVGSLGSTGRATGPHLHWSIRLVGTRVDPMSLLKLLGGS
jgi:murein DD-endopeptidase MepM/ murein hydrolase activator NlpD